MENKEILVSAIITTHNRADLLPRALKSVLAQTYQPIEIIVVDDASEDNTEKVIRKFQKKHDIRYIKNETSQGPAKTRNIGIEAATGKFIAGLDDDDEWHPERIAEMVGAYSDEYAFVTTDTTMRFPNGKAVWRKKKNIDLQTLLFTNQVGNQVLVRRDRMLKVGGFDTEMTAVEDYDLWVRLCAAYGTVRNVQKSLQTIYMDHQKERVTDREFKGYVEFYNKHKHQLSRAQRKYQLFKIRRAQGKPVKISEFIACVPVFRILDELKSLIAKKIWN